MEDVLAVYEQRNPCEPRLNRARLCFDERPCQLLDDVVAPLPAKPGKTAREDNEYVRRGTCVVLLAYDLDTGKRYTQTRKQRTKAGYARFMQQIISTHNINPLRPCRADRFGAGQSEHPQVRILL